MTMIRRTATLPPLLPKLTEPDAHGQAALLLAESMLHALVEASTLTCAEAVAVVRTAAEVKREVAAQAGESEARMLESLALLTKIQSSFETDDWPVPATSSPTIVES